MKLRKIFNLLAVIMVTAVFFTACTQSTEKSTTADADTEMAIDKGEEATKCGGDSEKCGEGKCGEGKEDSDTTAKCGEGKCGEGKCGEGEEKEDKKCGS